MLFYHEKIRYVAKNSLLLQKKKKKSVKDCEGQKKNFELQVKWHNKKTATQGR